MLLFALVNYPTGPNASGLNTFNGNGPGELVMQPAGGAETRPVNAGVEYLIKR